MQRKKENFVTMRPYACSIRMQKAGLSVAGVASKIGCTPRALRGYLCYNEGLAVDKAKAFDLILRQAERKVNRDIQTKKAA